MGLDMKLNNKEIIDTLQNKLNKINSLHEFVKKDLWLDSVCSDHYELKRYVNYLLMMAQDKKVKSSPDLFFVGELNKCFEHFWKVRTTSTDLPYSAKIKLLLDIGTPGYFAGAGEPINAFLKAIEAGISCFIPLLIDNTTTLPSQAFLHILEIDYRHEGWLTKTGYLEEIFMLVDNQDEVLDLLNQKIFTPTKEAQITIDKFILSRELRKSNIGKTEKKKIVKV
jgi:hypothetical protein